MSYTGNANAISAFPGAEGFGANSVGGRGGTVIKVTNLNDSGTGSFRAAVTATGARIVVFDVSGIINLQSDLNIYNPYLTIAGQTSPGGILIAGMPTLINTHNVIIQHMRFRLGTNRVNFSRDTGGNIIYYSSPQYQFPPSGGICSGSITTEQNGFPCALAGGADPETFDALDIAGNQMLNWFPNPAYNIIVDHSSISWAVDENMSTCCSATDITIQWSIISEGLSRAGHPKGEHSKGFLSDNKLFGGNQPASRRNISFHHNYMAHNRDRSPAMIGGEVDTFMEAINNVIYNPYARGGSYTQGNINKMDWKHNFIKRGIDTYADLYEVGIFSDTAVNPYIYVEGNIGVHRLDQTYPQWAVQIWDGVNWAKTLASTGYQKTTPWNPSTTVTTQTMSSEVANSILSTVGATKPFRDSVDARVVADFANGTGTYLNNVSYPSGFPTFTTPAAPTDSDNDGMPDTWETSKGLNPSLPSDGNVIVSSGIYRGYTNIEYYLGEMAGNVSSTPPDTTPPAAPTGLAVM